MADEEHMRKLQEGVEVWNQWRLEHPDIQPDLRDAHLSGADLHDTKLREADLSSAQLSGVYLSGADLTGTDLGGVHLEAAFFDTRSRLAYVSFSDGKSRSASVADVRWSGVNLAIADWESVKMLGDEYDARDATDLFSYQSAVRANRQLAVVLRDQGLNEQADRFAYRAQLLQRVVWRKQEIGKDFFIRRRSLKYIFSWFLDLLAGYGYRPGHALLWYFAVIVGFATAYAIFGHLPPFQDALVFSLMSFHGRVFFPNLSNQTNLHNPLVMLAAAEAVIGLFVEISFIATFTQRFFGR